MQKNVISCSKGQGGRAHMAVNMERRISAMGKRRCLLTKKSGLRRRLDPSHQIISGGTEKTVSETKRPVHIRKRRNRRRCSMFRETRSKGKEVF